MNKVLIKENKVLKKEKSTSLNILDCKLFDQDLKSLNSLPAAIFSIYCKKCLMVLEQRLTTVNFF